MTGEKDLLGTIKYIAWATVQKTYTIFKTHPCAGGNTHYDILWNIAKKHNILKRIHRVSRWMNGRAYLKVRIGCKHGDSGLTFKAILHDKPVCTLRGPSMTTDIVLLVETDDSILDVKAVPYKDKIKWLNWFYGRVCIDFHKEDYKERLLEKLHKYKKTKQTIMRCINGNYGTLGAYLIIDNYYDADVF